MLFLINRRLGRCRRWVTWVVDGVGEWIPAVLIIYMSHGGCLSSLYAVSFDEERNGLTPCKGFGCLAIANSSEPKTRFQHLAITCSSRDRVVVAWLAQFTYSISRNDYHSGPGSRPRGRSLMCPETFFTHGDEYSL